MEHYEIRGFLVGTLDLEDGEDIKPFLDEIRDGLLGELDIWHVDITEQPTRDSPSAAEPCPMCSWHHPTGAPCFVSARDSPSAGKPCLHPPERQREMPRRGDWYCLDCNKVYVQEPDSPPESTDPAIPSSLPLGQATTRTCPADATYSYVACPACGACVRLDLTHAPDAPASPTE
jgi:hypothetical protein